MSGYLKMSFTDAGRFAAIFAGHRLPPVQEPVLDMRWVARTNEWWHRTASGWFWFDARTKQWLSAPSGP